MKAFKIYFGILVAAASLVSCGGAKQDNVGSIDLVSDGCLENVMSQEAEIYKIFYPDMKFEYSFLPDSCVIDSLVSGNANVVMSSRELTDAEVNKAKENKMNVRSSIIAVDGVALIVNNENPCGPLFVREIKDIMSGEMKNWNDISPSKLGDINIIFDNKGYGNYTYIEDSIMHGRITAKNVVFEEDYKKVIERVKSDKSALGVLSVSSFAADSIFDTLSLADKAKALRMQDKPANIQFAEGFKVLKVRFDDKLEAYAPYSAYIYSGEYPLCRNYYLITTAMAGTAANGFYSFMLQNDGQRILVKSGMLPSVNLKR